METFGHNVVYSAEKEKNISLTLVHTKQWSLFCTGYAQREKRCGMTAIQLCVISKDGCVTVAGRLSPSVSRRKNNLAFLSSMCKCQITVLSIRRHRFCLWREKRACCDRVQLRVSHVLLTCSLVGASFTERPPPCRRLVRTTAVMLGRVRGRLINTVIIHHPLITISGVFTCK